MQSRIIIIDFEPYKAWQISLVPSITRDNKSVSAYIFSQALTMAPDEQYTYELKKSTGMCKNKKNKSTIYHWLTA